MLRPVSSVRAEERRDAFVETIITGGFEYEKGRNSQK